MNEEGRIQEAQAFRAVLERAISGWSDLTAGHFGIEPGEEKVPFSAEARSEFLDCRPDMAQTLMIEIAKRLAERKEKLEAARKN